MAESGEGLIERVYERNCVCDSIDVFMLNPQIAAPLRVDDRCLSLRVAVREALDCERKKARFYGISNEEYQRRAQAAEERAERYRQELTRLELKVTRTDNA